MSTRTHTYVTASDGQRLAVRTEGNPDGPVLLLVHGYPDNSSVWDAFAARFTADHRVAAFDVRGAGRSTAPDDRSGYRLDQLADDIVTVADAVSPGAPVHLVGHDWGAIQSWHAVTEPRHAHRFASYTAVSGPDLDHAGHWLRTRPDGFRAALRQAVRSGYIGFFHLPVVPEAAWLTGVGGLALSALERLGGGPHSPARRGTRDYLNGLALYRANMARRLLRPVERRTDVPVQVLAPTDDAFMTDQLQSDAGRWVGDLRFHRFHGGHWTLRSRPDAVAARVRALVGEVESGRPRPRRALTAQQARRHGGSFAGQVAVVTGAGSGIGRSLCFELAERGARIVAVDVNGPAAERTAELAALLTPGAAAQRVDVTDAAAMDKLAAWVRDEYGVPDLVVNNAGIGVAGPFLETTAQDWERVVDVNLWGVIHGCRAFAPMMAAAGGGGRLVNTASAAAYLPSRVYGAYATTKAAVLMLSRSLRGELADHGVSVTAVCPGLVDTGIISGARLSGLGEASAAKDRLNRLYRLRGYTPERAAARIADALQRGPEIVPVTGEAHLGLLLSRLSPRVLRAAARVAPPV
ncbi:SDR family oxidoreductase [Nocardiopsis sp. NRRL B-16309]|uniref:SDR family oxidoreductase n=1 Tax=Nocardiopsis sp. NRRL B-16309 TaxID=1519494 RepID=UPI0006B0332C|nr:SDR family oxidoreductase [Nocardiopsis sp. NRRL B-16309]KOX18249.1 short-chain dehydrogenase [Nocardiopsis sp. NRRL B-16309]